MEPFTNQRMAPMTPVTITIYAARQRYGVGRTLLYTLMDKGTVRSVKVGGRRLIVVADADAYFKRGDQPQSAAA
jgi:hypothetical protein